MHSQPGEGSLTDSYKNVWMLFKRARKFGFCDENYTTAELFDKADARLFRPVQKPENCLLSDTINSCSMELRERGHSSPFLQCKYNLFI